MLKKLLVEWLRLTDRMVQYKSIEPELKDLEKEQIQYKKVRDKYFFAKIRKFFTMSTVI